MPTKETQYEPLLQQEREPLGLMTSYAWGDDPKRLAFTLARYKFVAKLLQGYNRVLEIGCADAFGTRIVLQHVGHVTAIDFDPVFIADVLSRFNPKWPIEALTHDVLDSPPPGTFDAVYLLDVLEHIKPEDEDRFLTNAAAPLGVHGVMIVGSPSLESQAYASSQSKIGHVNCKTGEGLRATMEKHFNTVFCFSMNDEVVHTGFAPMAHYLWALCVAPKRG